VTSPITADQLTPIELGAAERRSFGERATHIATTTWFGTTIAVGFDTAAAADLHARRYARLPGDGAAELCTYAVVEGDATYFWIDRGPAFRWNERLEPPAMQFLADVVTRTEYFMERSTYQSFHAAVVGVNGSAAAITAPSTGGKTTTAIACVRRGMPLYSDERCIVDGTLALPFPRALNVRAESIELLTEGAPDDSLLSARLAQHRGSDWTFVDYAELFGNAKIPEPRPLRAIFFITRFGRTASVRPMPFEAAVTELLGAPLRSRARGTARVVDATRLLRHAQPYGLTLGSPDDTARLIAQTV